MPTEAYTTLRSGQVLEAALLPFLNAFGFWFYVILVGTFSVGLYIRQRSVVMPVVLTVLVGSWMASSMTAEGRMIGYLMVAVGGASIFYSLYRGANR